MKNAINNNIDKKITFPNQFLPNIKLKFNKNQKYNEKNNLNIMNKNKGNNINNKIEKNAQENILNYNENINYMNENNEDNNNLNEEANNHNNEKNNLKNNTDLNYIFLKDEIIKKDEDKTKILKKENTDFYHNL